VGETLQTTKAKDREMLWNIRKVNREPFGWVGGHSSVAGLLRRLCSLLALKERANPRKVTKVEFRQVVAT
jgi:hypothetical protein